MPHTLLAADDSATIRRVIELTFAERDIHVVTAVDGDEAIRSLESAPPDIVLADILMPGRSGYEVARHVRDSAKLSHIPVLLLAGAFEAVDHSMAASLGCAGILTKPLDPQFVIRRVSELLAARDVDAERAGEDDVPAAGSEPAIGAPVETPATPPPPVPFPAPAAVSSPRTPEPSIAELLLALPAVPVSAPGAPAPPQLEVSDPPAPPTPSDREVEAYFEELDQRLAGMAREDRPGLHVVEPRTVAPGDEGVGSSPEPAAGVSGSDAGDATPRPSLVDAFSALLSAECSAQGRAAMSVRPAPAALTAPVPEDVLERVTRRALDRLSNDAIQAMVERVVSETAERLIREEIERIKSNIK